MALVKVTWPLWMNSSLFNKNLSNYLMILDTCHNLVRKCGNRTLERHSPHLQRHAINNLCHIKTFLALFVPVALEVSTGTQVSSDMIIYYKLGNDCTSNYCDVLSYTGLH